MNIQNIKPKKKRPPPTAQQIKERERKSYEKRIRSLFEKVGFTRVKTDKINITFHGRSGELDEIFIYENLVIICEYYTGQTDSTHFLKKKPLFDLIQSNRNDFFALCRTKFPGFNEAIRNCYTDEESLIKIVYATKNDPHSELPDLCPNVSFLSGNIDRYFSALIKAIEKSARAEVLKFLGFSNSDVGEASLISGKQTINYEGFLLPEKQSSYPNGYKIVSFYADPERLIDKCYVLRRDGWRDDYHLYQRILIAKKIRKMRGYLSSEGRVYVNNVIVTLPPETNINEIDQPGRNLPEADLVRAKPVSIQIPAEFDAIGIVDGQHRVYCYHEGSDKPEEKIKTLRKKQTLLVTGIVYPKLATEPERRRFEAKLFLEINNNQTRVQSALTHEIELILHPFSTTSLAKRVIKELAKSGPYRGLLQTGFFDAPEKIKTASIVSYGLRPLIKMDGSDSLFSVWDGKSNLKDKDGKHIEAMVDEYIRFAVGQINQYFLAAKSQYGGGGWSLDADPISNLLKPTVINGLIVCLRKLINNGHPLDDAYHKKSLSKLSTINLDSYRSSQWQRLGQEIFETCYGGVSKPDV